MYSIQMDIMPTAVSTAALAADPARAFGAAAVAPQAWLKHPPRGPAGPASQDRPAAAVPAPESLHPSLWLGHQLGRQAAQALASGFAALDAELPGGGWPRRTLTELLLPHPGVGEIRLLAPSLAAQQRAGRLVMLFDPPAALCAPALVALGIDVAQLLVVNTRARLIPGSDSRTDKTADEVRLWAFEQALKSGHVGAAVAWLPPRLRAERVRRLQLAAQAHDGPAFVLRELAVADRPSAAPLRLALRPGGADALAVRVLKRRGPPLAALLQLALPPVLADAARGRARRSEAPLPAATFVNLA
jgi:protein ImuA